MASIFPQFSDGDVEIQLSSNSADKFVLHSYVLALHSTWFKASLSERWNGENGSSAGVIGKNRWVYELRFDEDSALGLLARASDSARLQATAVNKMIDSSTDTNMMSTVARKLQEQRMAKVKAHVQLLGSLYHLASDFSHQSFEKARASILCLTEIAQAYGAQKVVKVHVESHLRLYKEDVLRLCSSTPVDMLELALTTRSEWIFMEAATLLIGQHEKYYTDQLPRLNGLKIMTLMQRKRNEFLEGLKSCELQLLLISADERTAYSLDAINFFRDFVVTSIARSYGSGLRVGYAKLYRSIAQMGRGSPDALDLTMFTRYLKLFYTKPSTDIRSKALANIFQKAAKTIEPIMRDVTRLQDKSYDQQEPLRFVSIADDELPWVNK